MIPERAIREWNEMVPWQSPAMVEQDLIISRALVSIFSDDFLRENLAFRGGTALHKLYITPAGRYSEDIDLVQINPGPIKDIMFRLGEVLDWLPNRSTAQKRHSNKMYFRFDSEIAPVEHIRLKIEINCLEHFNVMGFTKFPFKVENSWFTGEAEITTYFFEELIGTKMRALYQRKKGRDLYDLYMALTAKEMDLMKVIESYQKYTDFVAEHIPTYKEYTGNLSDKMKDEEFVTDVQPLLRPNVEYNSIVAWEMVQEKLVEKLPGRRD